MYFLYAYTYIFFILSLMMSSLRISFLHTVLLSITGTLCFFFFCHDFTISLEINGSVCNLIYCVNHMFSLNKKKSSSLIFKKKKILHHVLNYMGATNTE